MPVPVTQELARRLELAEAEWNPDQAGEPCHRRGTRH